MARFFKISPLFKKQLANSVIFLLIITSISACKGTSNHNTSLAFPDNLLSTASNLGSVTSSSSSSSSSGSNITINPEWANCNTSTPQAWPCNLSLSDGRELICNKNGACSFATQANGFAGWDIANCQFDVEPGNAGCRVFKGDKIQVCTYHNHCARLHQPVANNFDDTANASDCNSRSHYKPCTYRTPNAIGGCDAIGLCGGGGGIPASGSSSSSSTSSSSGAI